MDTLQPYHRSDEQLEAILYETADWVVNGRQGQLLCLAPSLRQAMIYAASLSTSALVSAVSQRAPIRIYVFPAQLERLEARIAASEGQYREVYGFGELVPRAA